MQGKRYTNVGYDLRNVGKQTKKCSEIVKFM